MAQMTFGFNQMWKPTPTIVGRIKRALNFFSAGILLYLGFFADKLKVTAEDLSTYMGIFMLFFNTVLLMFGAGQQGDTVPAADATEVKTGNT